MIIDYFPASVAADANGNVARNAEANVYALSDTGFSTPLAITDLQGVPMAKLVASAVGIFPPFRVVNGTLQIVAVSGDLKTPMTSLSVYANAAEAGAQMAATSAGAASSAASTAETARTAALAAATAAQAVGNTNDTIIEGRIKDPASKTAVALSSAIAQVAGQGGIVTRSGDAWWDTVFAAPPAADLPVIALVTAASGAVTVAPTADLLDEHFRAGGMPSLTSPASGFVTAVSDFATATPAQRYAFVTEAAAVVEIPLRASTSGDYRVRVWVNGKPVSVQMPVYTLPVGVRYLRLTFPSARAREIMVEWGATLAFGGAVVPTGQSVHRAAGGRGPRVAILGDSYVGGAGSAPDGASRLETYAWFVAALLGASDWRSFGIGGTGYVNAGTAAPYSGRVDAILAYAPDILIVSGSRNDSGGYAAVRDAALTVLGSVASLGQVFVTGPSTSPFASVGEAVREAALRSGVLYIDGLDPAWITSADLGSDNVHPTLAGHQKIARGLFAGIRERQGVSVASAAASGIPPAPDAIATTTALAASPADSATSGAAVTLTATVSPSAATGVVTFYNGSAAIGTGTVTGGVATLVTSALPVGARSLSASFANGTSAYKPSTSTTLSYTIAPPSMLRDGAMLLVKPSAWPSLTSVPADAATVPNAAWAQLAAILGSGSESSLAARIRRTANTPSTLVLERSGKGGLHGIFSQTTTTQAAASGNVIQADVRPPAAMTDYLVANPTDDIYVSIWATVTRASNDANDINPMSVVSSQTSPSANYLAAIYPSGGLPSAGSGARVGATVGTRDVGAPQRRSIATAGFQGAVPAASGLDDFVATWGNSSALNRINRGSGPSFILYQVYVHNLTRSGLTFAEIDAIDQANFDAAFGSGGALAGDTVFTDPSTVP